MSFQVYPLPGLNGQYNTPSGTAPITGSSGDDGDNDTTPSTGNTATSIGSIASKGASSAQSELNVLDIPQLIGQWILGFDYDVIDAGLTLIVYGAFAVMAIVLVYIILTDHSPTDVALTFTNQLKGNAKNAANSVAKNAANSIIAG